MSRRILALCLVFCLLFIGCSRKPSAEPISADFVCDFRAQYNDMTAEGTLTRRTAGTLLLEFSKPETLDGLSAEWDGEKVTLQYLGLSYDVDPDKLPESALGEGLLSAFDAVLREEGTKTEQDGKVTVTGITGKAEYTYVYDSASGAPLSLSIPSVPLTVTFSNIQTN